MTTKIPSSFSPARTARRWPREITPSKLISRSVENDPDVGSKIQLVVAVHGIMAQCNLQYDAWTSANRQANLGSASHTAAAFNSLMAPSSRIPKN